MVGDEMSGVRPAQVSLSWSDPTVIGSLGSGDVSLPIGTVTFLLADVVGSTRHWQRSPEAMEVAVAQVDALLDRAISAHGGVRPTEQGEVGSVVAAFSRASDAVLAARDAQSALLAEQWTTNEPVRVRMAVHTGDTTVRDEGADTGRAIVRTARLRSIAHGGQVLISSVARDLAVDQLGTEIELIHLGSHRLKDLARPEEVWQLADPIGTGFPSLRSLDSVPNNLPLQLSTFVGRLDEISTVAGLVRGNRLVTITGTGGVGKTRLSQQVAAEVSDRFVDGAWWVELVAVSEDAAIAVSIAAAIGERIPSGAQPGRALAAAIAARRMLLVLDNCEHVVADVAHLVAELLLACPNLTILATSRIGLDVPGEVTWRVPALSLPSPEVRVPIAVLGQFDAVQLFVERARQVRPNFALDDANGPAIAEICHRLDGIPLALELAAARCRALSPARIREGLNDSLRLLTGGARTVLPRQQTLAASIDWSHSLLSDIDRILLRRVSVFVGGFDLNAAEAVTPDSPPDLVDDRVTLSSLEVLDGLDRLVEQSLVSIDDTDPTGDARYRLLETVRQYARAKLAEHGETDVLLDAHCHYFRRRPAGISSGHAVVLADADNVLAALDRAATACPIAEYVDFLVPVVTALTPTQRSAQLDAVIERCLQRLGPGRSIEHARVLLVRGRVHLFAGRIAEQRADAEAAREIGELLNDDASIGRALNLLGSSWASSDPVRAATLLERGVSHSLAAQDWMMAITSYSDLGMAYATQRDLPRASTAYDAHADLEREHPSRYLLADGLAGRARVAFVSAEYDAAWRLFASVRDTLDQLGAADDPWLGPFVAFGEISIALERGQRPTEASLGDLRAGFDAALSKHQYLGVYFFGAGLLGAAMERSDHDEARQLVDLLNIIGAGGLTSAEAEGRLTSAALHHQAGNLSAALDDVERGRAICGTLRDDIGAALFDVRAGLIARSQRDVGEAESLVHGALRTVSERGFRREVVIALEAVVLTDAASNSWTDAARLHGAASRLRDELGYRLRVSPERESYAQVIDGLADSHAEAIAEGAGMDWPAAAAYALRSWGSRKRPAFGWSSLTPTERQVVDLAIQGLTNPQIAERLIMGRATVKTHLSNAYTKLAVKNRTELATRAAAELPSDRR